MEKTSNYSIYFNNIESKIIESIQHSEKSIKIAMAWFTSVPIKRALLNHKTRFPKISVEILVDNNKANDNYFYNSATDFGRVGIVIHPERPEMMHNKFMVVDDLLTMIGSYNLSKNAKSNLENICIVECAKFSSIYSRVFRSLTDHAYLDENIELLTKYPDFSRKLISMYYPFSQVEFLTFKDKLISGRCYTYDYGFGNRLYYEAGYLFNESIDLSLITGQEFRLPFNKQFIQSWEVNNNMLNILDSFAGQEEYYHLINDELKRSEQQVNEYFKRIIESTYTSDELENYIIEDVDIVIEDRLWCDNFGLFFRKQHLEQLLTNVNVALPS